MKSSNDRHPSGETLLVGEIVGVHGLRGALKMRSYADSPGLFETGLKVYLETPDGHVQTRSVTWAKPHGKGILLAIEGVADRETAEGLIGSRLLVARAMLPELEEGTFDWFDLIGMTVYSRRGRYL